MRFPPDYRERVYAGWIGKSAGVRFGAPVENWTYQEIRETLGELKTYLPLPAGKIFKPDDDTAFPMVIVKTILDFGPEVAASHFGETMLNYLSDQRGTLWWGGYGISTEHTAYLNLASGIPAPLSGSAELNGLSLAEQIGGQIFSDIWGLVVPNDVHGAARYGALAASISHDGNGILGGMFVAALASAAFSFKNPRQLVLDALAVIPSDSQYARVVHAMLDFHSNQVGTWHDAYHFLAREYGYDKYSGVVPIIPNAGVIVLALLYGDGDFSRTLRIGNMCGWDTDCNVGNLGAIMGVAVGLEGIGQEWRDPQQDELVLASVIGSANYTDLSSCSDTIADCGELVAGQKNSRSPYRYHFGHPGSTQGFRIGSDAAKTIQLLTVSADDGRQTFGGHTGLCAVIKKLGKKSQASFFVKTHCRIDELSANYYGATFSPKLYPGQTITASVFLPEGSADSFLVSLYYRDAHQGRRTQQMGVALIPGESTLLSWKLERLENALISEVGIVVHNIGNGLENGSVLLEHLHWEGGPDFYNDFSRERPEGGGISGWTAYRGYWRLEGGRAVGSGYEAGEQYTGSPQWRDYRLGGMLVPNLGSFHGIMARVQGTRRSYVFALTEGQSATLYKKEEGRLVAMGTAAFAWELGKPYTLSLSVQGSALVAGIGGEELIRVEDTEKPYSQGQVGLTYGGGCRTTFVWVDVQPL
ncbi:MAG: ADP-ribosylglycohydrolase family protein [Sphaerochaeta sp.]|nr:ADP-ribosylglycohydrolase family protein [Sphaerochaeta sp.]